jgi:hypothetical protein
MNEGIQMMCGVAATVECSLSDGTLPFLHNTSWCSLLNVRITNPEQIKGSLEYQMSIRLNIKDLT